MHNISLGRIALMGRAAPELRKIHGPLPMTSLRRGTEPPPGNISTSAQTAGFGFAKADPGAREETKTSCVSCHTLASFAVARPAFAEVDGGLGQADRSRTKTPCAGEDASRTLGRGSIPRSTGCSMTSMKAKQKQSWGDRGGPECVSSWRSTTGTKAGPFPAMRPDAQFRQPVEGSSVPTSDQDGKLGLARLQAPAPGRPTPVPLLSERPLAAIRRRKRPPGYYKPGADADSGWERPAAHHVPEKPPRGPEPLQSHLAFCGASKGLDGPSDPPTNARRRSPKLLELQQARRRLAALAMLAGVGAPQRRLAAGHDLRRLRHRTWRWHVAPDGRCRERGTEDRAGGLNWAAIEPKPDRGVAPRNSINKQRGPGRLTSGRFMFRRRDRRMRFSQLSH